MLDVHIKSPLNRITYADSIVAIGSCFTEHIGRRLEELKFPILQNPNGILFDPLSVCKSLNAYMEGRQYQEADLFFLNELWQSWDHHSHFSAMNAKEVLNNINTSQLSAYEQLKKTNWLIISLGSSFSYQLVENGQSVANCHRAPGQWFNKHLLTTNETVEALTQTIERLKVFNPACNIIFTISPVRHIRDGVVENNRSKARLLEAVHTLVDLYNHAHYFPAYEIVIDVLRDYRFFDIDLVHPNYAATEYVFEKFVSSFIDEEATSIMEEVKKIMTSYKHKPFHPETKAHQLFLQSNIDKIKELGSKFPYLDFSQELYYFQHGGKV